MRGKYFLVLIALSALWGATFMLTRITAAAFGPSLSTLLRIGVATATLGAIMLITGKSWPWRHWREIILASILGVAGPHLFYSWSALTLPASYGSLISVSAVFFGAIASSVFMKAEHMTKLRWFGCFLGFIGTAMALQFGPVHFSAGLVQGALLCVLGSFCAGVAVPFLKRAITHMGPLELTAAMHLAATPMLLPGGLLEWGDAQFPAEALVSIFIMGACTSGIGYWVYNNLMRHIPPVAALSVNFMSTGFGVFWAVALLSETVGGSMVTGGILLLLSTFLVMDYNPLTKIISIPSPTLPDLFAIRTRNFHEWLYRAIFRDKKERKSKIKR